MAFNFESMKSTTSLRPATPPPPALLFRYFAAPLTPSTAPWKSPGTIGLSTSAITAIRISVAVTPISVAAGCFGPPEPAAAGAGPVIAMATATKPATTTALRRADDRGRGTRFSTSLDISIPPMA